jgi:hypothetical protein
MNEPDYPPPPSPAVILSETAHRPFPVADGSWVMAQSWNDLLFMHWPVDPEMLRPKIPQQLTLETFDGSAWVGVVPFYMSHVRPRYLFSVPWLSFFAELNVRTYVTDGKKPGVWFFSLDAARRIGVELARMVFHLPYFHAKMAVEREGEAVRYRSKRTDGRGGPGEYRATYQPTGEVYMSTPGTLDYFLTERYALYSQSRSGTLYRAEIHHMPWPLQPAEADVQVNTVCDMHGITLPDQQPLLHFARRQDMLGWMVEKLET